MTNLQTNLNQPQPTSLKMTKLEIQRKLYDARNAYIKAQKQVEYQINQIAFLNQSLNDYDLDLYSEMFDF